MTAATEAAIMEEIMTEKPDEMKCSEGVK